LEIERLCRAADVSRASFYRSFQRAEPSAAEMLIRDAVQKAAVGNRRYGYRRVAVLVQRQGVAVGARHVLRIMREDNLLAVRRRKFVVTTDSDHDFLVYPNLAQSLALTDINQLWVADITYLRLALEFVYLAVVLDAFSRLVVGWALSRSLQAKLPLAALQAAIAQRRPGSGLVHHSDRGSQYASDDYVKVLEQHKMLISMSRPARPWENAKCESFMKTLKSEEIEVTDYRTMEELQENIENFIARYYNTIRLHSALGYLSPAEFERRHAAQRREQATSLPAALSFRRHKEIYPDVLSH
jgi:transposase InsO family protein